MTLPLLSCLRHGYPDAMITVFCRDGVRELFQSCPAVNRVYDLLPIPPHLRTRPEVLEHFQHFRSVHGGGFDLVINPRPAPDWYLTGHYVETLADAKRVGFAQTLLVDGYDPAPAYTMLLPLPPEGEHPVLAGGRVCAALGLETYRPCPSLRPGLAARAWSQHLMGNEAWVALGIGAADHYRRWPSENFQALCRQLRHWSFRVVLVGTEQDTEAARSMTEAAPDAVLDLTGNTSLDQLAAVLSGCRLFIGNDSGPKHIAAAVGTRVVEIGCYSPLMPGFSYERYFDAVGVPQRRLLPEEMFTREDMEAGRAIASITVGRVVAAAHEMLKSET